MSRTNHPNRYNYNSHPYWLYQWWGNRVPASMRRTYNRIDRARAKQILRNGEEPPPRRRSILWFFW